MNKNDILNKLKANQFKEVEIDGLGSVLLKKLNTELLFKVIDLGKKKNNNEISEKQVLEANAELIAYSLIDDDLKPMFTVEEVLEFQSNVYLSLSGEITKLNFPNLDFEKKFTLIFE